VVDFVCCCILLVVLMLLLLQMIELAKRWNARLEDWKLINHSLTSHVFPLRT